MRKLLPIIVLAVLVAVIGLTQYSPFVKKQAPLDGHVLKVHFIDVGQGDCTLVQTPDGRSILIDAGDEGSGDTVVSYLRDKGVGRIDLLVITHPHSDHIGGLPRVLDEFGVSRVLDAGYPHGSQTYKDILGIIESRRIDYKVIQDFRKPEAGTQVSFDVLWPPADYQVGRESELNNGSIVLRLKYGSVSVLLTGDIQDEAEGTLLADRQDLQSTILKVAHHGSEYSTSNEFLQVVKPDFAVISVGQGNDYGHPAKDTLDRLIAAGAKVFRTDENGSVVFTSDGTNVQVDTER